MTGEVSSYAKEWCGPFWFRDGRVASGVVERGYGMVWPGKIARGNG